MSERHPSPERTDFAQNREKLELAESFFRIAEETARPLDELALRSLVSAVSTNELLEMSQRIRRTVFNRACDVLGLTEPERHQVLDNS